MIAIVTIVMDFSGMRSQKVAQSFARTQEVFARAFGIGVGLTNRGNKGSTAAINTIESAALLQQSLVLGAIKLGSGINNRRLGGSDKTWKIIAYPLYCSGMKDVIPKGSTPVPNNLDATNFVSQTLDLRLTTFTGLRDTNPKGSTTAISIYDVTPLLQQTLVTVGTLSFTGTQPDNRVGKSDYVFNNVVTIPKYSGIRVKRIGTSPNTNVPLYSTQDIYLQTNQLKTNQILFTSLNYFGSPQQPQMIQFWS